MIVPISSEEARYCIDVYKTGCIKPVSIGASTNLSVYQEIDRIGKDGNFTFIELSHWHGSLIKWGTPIAIYEPHDFKPVDFYPVDNIYL